MGNNLFGANIAGKLAAAFAGKLQPVTIVRNTPTARDPANPSGGTGLAPTTVIGNGFVEDFALGLIDGTRIVKGDKRISVLGDSLTPGPFVPRANDLVTIEGKQRTVIAIVGRDPDAALYVLQCRG